MYGWIRTNGYFYNRNMTDCFLQPNIRFLRAYPIVRYSALPTELHTIFKMVGAVGLAPTKAFRPGNLQSPAIAAMRYSQKQFGVGLRECLQTSLRPITRYLV